MSTTTVRYEDGFIACTPPAALPLAVAAVSVAPVSVASARVLKRRSVDSAADMSYGKGFVAATALPAGIQAGLKPTHRDAAAFAGWGTRPRRNQLPS